MRISILLFFTMLSTLISSPAFAQDWAKAKLNKSPRHLEWVDIKAGNRKVHTFVAYPESKNKATVVLLIHEIFGLSDWVRETADALAAQGYIAVAPDLLSGMAPGGKGSDGYTDDDARIKVVSSLPPEQVTSDLKHAMEYAHTIPAGNGKVVVAGFCWGGGQTFRFATNAGEGIKAAYVFYGPSPDAIGMPSIHAPVYGFYAENDARITSTIDDTKKKMVAAGKTFDPVIYKGAGHGFMRAGEAPDAKPADRAAREAAWKRWLELLKRV
jgi:carboxymethylenebutenolidase